MREYFITPFNTEHFFTVIALLLPIFLYAEIHYHLPFFAGRLYKKQPEIIFDLPYRIQRDFLPVMLLIKDSGRYPVNLVKVTLILKCPRTKRVLQKYSFSENLTISKKWFTKIYNINVNQFKDQWLEIECIASVKIREHYHVIKNDNYPTLSNGNFKTYIDSEPLPAVDEWIWGDLHCHSSWTEDQVEFGIPAEKISTLAVPMGISFCALTDHSYDLDDLPDSWIKTDPELTKWKKSRKQIKSLNNNSDNFLIIPGEEVSVDNGLGKNIHMAVLNSSKFYFGSGDGFEKLISKASENHYAKILDNLPKVSMAFAAHPQAKPPFLQKFLIKRGVWNQWDSHRRLSGYQIMNGSLKEDFINGKKNWIQQILKGKKKFIYAGNDSHGNFNRFRQVKLPMWKLHERNYQIFGEHLTAVKSTTTHGVGNLLDDLKKGQVIISNGPFINFTIQDDSKHKAPIGEELLSIPTKSNIAAISTKFFGGLKNIELILGDIKHRKEFIFSSITLNPGCFRKIFSLKLDNLPDKGYFRMEVHTQKDKFALSNPIWYSKPLP